MQTPEHDPRTVLLSLQDAADRLHLKPSTLRSYHKRGELPFVRLGHHFYVAESDLIAFIAAKTEHGEPTA